MRSSDWSSDVCSSDLACAAARSRMRHEREIHHVVSAESSRFLCATAPVGQYRAPMIEVEHAGDWPPLLAHSQDVSICSKGVQHCIEQAEREHWCPKIADALGDRKSVGEGKGVSV